LLASFIVHSFLKGLKKNKNFIAFFWISIDDSRELNNDGRKTFFKQEIFGEG
jgi:hypothetical protein